MLKVGDRIVIGGMNDFTFHPKHKGNKDIVIAVHPSQSHPSGYEFTRIIVIEDKYPNEARSYASYELKTIKEQRKQKLQRCFR